LRLVEETFTAQGPFDGILGFSQGASLTALIAAHSQQNAGTKNVYQKYQNLAHYYCENN
jgi:Serine hydrolase (FSH1)